MAAAEEEPRRRRYEIGYALAPKKQQSFIQASLLSMASSRGIDLLPVDPALPLANQGPFDALLHKLSGPQWELQLREFAAKYPDTPVIDPPDAIERLHNRLSMLEVVSDLHLPRAGASPTFGIPKQIVVYDASSLADDSTAAALRFPVIAKPLVADGSAKSHKMALIFTRDGLLDQKPPLVLQEFVNHGGVIFKVYVVGDHVQCVRRRSLPDEDALERPAEEGSLPFSQVSNVNSAGATGQGCSDDDLAEAEMPPLSFLTEIAKGLRHAMGLHLFNFDVIRDVKIGNHYLVIDINYFPGYAKMPSYESVLTDFFWKIVHEKEDAGDGSGKIIMTGNHTDSVKENRGAEEDVKKEGVGNVG